MTKVLSALRAGAIGYCCLLVITFLIVWGLMEPNQMLTGREIFIATMPSIGGGMAVGISTYIG